MGQPESLLASVRGAEWVRRSGHVARFVGLTVESRGPDAHLGEVCAIHARSTGASVPAEVVGLNDGRVLLMPYDDLQGVEIGSEVTATGERAHVYAGPHLLGRVIDGIGTALDGRPLAREGARRPLYPSPLNPLARGAVCEVLETGVRAPAD